MLGEFIHAANSGCLVIFHDFLLSADIFQHYYFQNILS